MKVAVAAAVDVTVGVLISGVAVLLGKTVAVSVRVGRGVLDGIPEPKYCTAARAIVNVGVGVLVGVDVSGVTAIATMA